MYQGETNMRTISRSILAASITLLGAQIAFADAAQIGIVNVAQLFNQSKFIQSANQKMQDEVKRMETQIQAQQKKIQTLASQYEAMKMVDPNKSKLQQQIMAEQGKLSKMGEDFQQKLRTEQTAKMQDYTKLIQTAAEKVAKEKHLSGVLSNSAVVFAGPAWVDITSDVEKTLPTTAQ